MKWKILLSIILTVVSIKSNCQDMVTNEVLQRVFFIKQGNSTGSCFLVSINHRDYLITAKHLFTKNILSKTPVSIEIFRNNGWIKFNPTLLIHNNPQVDIAVLDLMTSDLNDNLFDLDAEGFYISQDCFFLGFPFGLKLEDKEGTLNNGFPLPFIKKALISSMITDTSKVTQIFLDGNNNPGFSGGPVVVQNYDRDKKHRMKIIAVVSAYLEENKVVKTPIGDFVNSENSGIILTYSIDHVYQIINQNK